MLLASLAEPRGVAVGPMLQPVGVDGRGPAPLEDLDGRRVQVAPDGCELVEFVGKPPARDRVQRAVIARLGLDPPGDFPGRRLRLRLGRVFALGLARGDDGRSPGVIPGRRDEGLGRLGRGPGRDRMDGLSSPGYTVH